MESKIQPNSPPAQPRSQASVSPSNNLLKIILFSLLGIVVIAGSIFAGIQVGKNQIQNQQSLTEQPTSTPAPSISNSTADWKTYTDTTWNFSVQYPRNWYLFTRNTAGIGDSVELANFDITGMQKKDTTNLIRVGIYRRKTGDVSADDYLKTRDDGPTVLSSKKVVIDGIEGVQQEEEGLGVNNVVYVIRDGYLYTIAAGPWNSNQSSIFDQILATFKFTN